MKSKKVYLVLLLILCLFLIGLCNENGTNDDVNEKINLEYANSIIIDEAQRSIALEQMIAEQAAAEQAAAEQAEEITTTYIGNKNTKKFHLPSCYTLPEEKNRVSLTDRVTAINQGYSPCGKCNP